MGPSSKVREDGGPGRRPEGMSEGGFEVTVVNRSFCPRVHGVSGSDPQEDSREGVVGV